MTDVCPHCGCELVNPKEHSDPMRRMFFAAIRDIWQTLPDHVAPMYPSSEHLRKAALVRAGWCNSTTTACGNRATAIRVAALARHLDEYAIVDISGSVVTVFTAKSMAKRACPKADFKRVADQALMWANGLIGVEKAA